MDFEKLHERVQITSRIRYAAARRLGRHQRYSQWTVSLLSVALILVSLWSALELPVGFSDNLLDAMQVFFAVLVLVYSLLLGMDDFRIRAERMHACGLEVGRLARKLEVYIGPNAIQGTQAEYEALSGEYYDILDQHENHEYVDYLLNRLAYAGDYKLSGWAYARAWTTTWFRYFLGFVHYALISLFIIIFIIAMIFTGPPAAA